MQVSSNLAAGGLMGAEGFPSHLDSHETFFVQLQLYNEKCLQARAGLEKPLRTPQPLSPEQRWNKGELVTKTICPWQRMGRVEEHIDRVLERAWRRRSPEARRIDRMPLMSWPILRLPRQPRIIKLDGVLQRVVQLDGMFIAGS